MRKQCFQAVIISIQIIQDAWRVQLLQRHLRHHFRNLFKRSCAARKCDKCIPSSIIFVFRSVISFVTISSVKLSYCNSASMKNFGSTPVTVPPACRTLSAISPSIRILIRHIPAHFRSHQSTFQSPALPASGSHPFLQRLLNIL